MDEKKIIIVQLGRIGDLILMTPMFKALKRDNPEHELHLLAGRKNYHLAVNHPLIDQVHVYNKSPLKTFGLLRTLRKNNFDIWIDPKDHYSTESKIFALISNAKLKIGYNGIFAYQVKPAEEQAGNHYTVRSLSALEYLHIFSTDIRPILYVDSMSEQKFERFLKANRFNEYYGINISANGPDRYWTTEKWIEVIHILVQENNKIIITCSPEDIQQAEYIVNNTANTYFYKTDSIIDVFSIVNRASLILTVDTCIVHIASAFNKPILALYVNLKDYYSQYLPLSDHFRYVMHPEDGSFVSQITVESVMQNYYSLKNEINNKN